MFTNTIKKLLIKRSYDSQMSSVNITYYNLEKRKETKVYMFYIIFLLLKKSLALKH